MGNSAQDCLSYRSNNSNPNISNTRETYQLEIKVSHSDGWSWLKSIQRQASGWACEGIYWAVNRRGKTLLQEWAARYGMAPQKSSGRLPIHLCSLLRVSTHCCHCCHPDRLLDTPIWAKTQQLLRNPLGLQHQNKTVESSGLIDGLSVSPEYSHRWTTQPTLYKPIWWTSFVIHIHSISLLL